MESAHNLNLDCMFRDEVKEVARQAGLLSLYCSKKQKAMDFRARGYIAQALALETAADLIYHRLAPSWRW
jgi:hypothetical protein